MSRNFLGRRDLLALADRAVEELEIPEWSTWVRVKAWDGATRWRVLQAWPQSRERRENLWALVAALSLVDEEGERLFTDADLGELAKKNARALDRIFTVALRLNGLEPGARESLGNDSRPMQNGDSTSSLPATSAV
jgi:hypothetical protein